jgi:YbbR domain-containing protein
MSLITESWRLKLLALGLAILMLGAVAFSQNPPTFKTLTVPIAYTGTVPPDLILINPQSKTNVRVQGLADAVAAFTAANVTAAFDLSKATAGPNVKVNLIVTSLVPNNVQITNPVVPIALDIDLKVQAKMTVVARAPRVTPGWQVTNIQARCPSSPCVVTFTGPQTWETNLNAYADFPNPVENSAYDILSQPILLVQNGTPLDLTVPTVPASGLDQTSAEILINAKTGTSSRQVVLIDSPPSHGPPTGYRVTNIVINPITVVISGAPADLVKVNTLSLPAVDLSGHTGDATFRVTIPYPSGVAGAVATARITYTISPNPNASPPPG